LKKFYDVAVFSLSRQRKRRSALRVAIIYSRAGGNKIFDHERIAHGRSNPQRRHATGRSVCVSTRGEQSSHSINVTGSCRQQKRRDAALQASRVDIGAGLDERFDCVNFFSTGSGKQRCGV
jgi:hypothetical protein